MTKQFVLIEATGDAILVNSDDDTLSTLQSLVDGYIECVTATKSVLGFDADVWVNEEGLYRQDFGINLVASYMTGRQLVGPAVIAKSTPQGETVGLTQGNIARLINDGLMLDEKNGAGGYSVAEVVAMREQVDA